MPYLRADTSASSIGVAALGRTHFSWRPDVARIVREVLGEFSGVTANTYVNHPWPGFDGQSVDFWGPGGRGDPLPTMKGYNIRRYLMRKPGAPHIRHTIYRRTLWTRWSGEQPWTAEDHIGALQHLHVTYL